MTAAFSGRANNAEHFDGDGDGVSDGQVTRNINQMLSLITIPLFSMLLAFPLLAVSL